MVVGYTLSVTFCLTTASSKLSLYVLITINHNIVGDTAFRLYYTAALNKGSFNAGAMAWPFAAVPLYLERLRVNFIPNFK